MSTTDVTRADILSLARRDQQRAAHRKNAREVYRNHHDKAHRTAVALAEKGHGVADVVAMTGVPIDVATVLVRGG